jgi:signal transduction histidine kinase
LKSGDRAWHSRIVTGPFEPKVLLLERRLALAGNRDVSIQLAVDEASAGAAQAEFGQELFLFLAGLWLVLSAAAAVQVQLGLKPLAKLREALKALRLNPSERLAVQDHPPEVEPLTQAINQLAETREADLARARRRAADLAHGLKTPLAVLKAQSRQVREIGGDAVADNLDKAVAAAAAAVEAELARARAAMARENNAAGSAKLRDVAERVVSVVERTEAGAALVFEIETAPELTLPGTSEELSEILGALVENAARFARRRVRIIAAADGAGVCVAVEDDGPGLQDWRAEEALIRGRRLDETGPGHGLGLAIARDLVEARGGSIALKRSELGGLKVEMVWRDRQSRANRSSGPI